MKESEKFPYKTGDKIEIISTLCEWSSYCSDKYPCRLPVGSVIAIKKFCLQKELGENEESFFFAFSGEAKGIEYGFSYSEKTKDCYKLIKNEGNKMKYEKIKAFNAEDLRKAGACDSGIEEFIRHFGFIKQVELNERNIEIMEKINDCIPFLLRKRFIKEVEKTYKRGDIFEVIPNEYCLSCRVILSQVGRDLFSLIEISGEDRGNRMTDPIEVKDYSKITQEELDKMRGCFNLVKIEE